MGGGTIIKRKDTGKINTLNVDASNTSNITPATKIGREARCISKVKNV